MTPLRTRPDEFKFQLWSRLSEKYQKILRGTVICVCGCGVVCGVVCGYRLIIILTLVSTLTLTRVWQKSSQHRWKLIVIFQIYPRFPLGFVLGVGNPNPIP